MKGAVTGCISFSVYIEENLSKLFGQNPIQAPDRPDDPLDLDIIQAHFARVAQLFADVREAFELYAYVLSWDNPLLTLFSMMVFVWTCLRFDVEYIGCLPFAGIIIYMAWVAFTRRNRNTTMRFVQREIENRLKVRESKTHKHTLPRCKASTDEYEEHDQDNQTDNDKQNHNDNGKNQPHKLLRHAKQQIHTQSDRSMDTHTTHHSYHLTCCKHTHIDIYIHKTTNQTERESSIAHNLYRPIGQLHIRVSNGMNLRSRELGLPGSVACRVLWDPLRFVHDDTHRKSITKIDPHLRIVQEIGDTAFVFKTNPVWDRMIMSKQTEQIQRIMQDKDRLYHDQVTTDSSKSKNNNTKKTDRNLDRLTLHLLQPIGPTRPPNADTNIDKDIDEGMNGDDNPNDAIGTNTHLSPVVESVRDNTTLSLQPWSSLHGAIVVRVRFRDMINQIPGFEDDLGEVVIPMTKIVKEKQMSGWYRLIPPGSAPTAVSSPDRFISAAIPANVDHTATLNSNNNNDDDDDKNRDDEARVYLTLDWKDGMDQKLVTMATTATETMSTPEPTSIDREISIVLEEQLTKWSTKNRTKIDLVGTSIGAIDSMIGLRHTLQSIQNGLGMGLDKVESVRNAFTFTVSVWIALYRPSGCPFLSLFLSRTTKLPLSLSLSLSLCVCVCVRVFVSVCLSHTHTHTRHCVWIAILLLPHSDHRIPICHP